MATRVKTSHVLVKHHSEDSGTYGFRLMKREEYETWVKKVKSADTDFGFYADYAEYKADLQAKNITEEEAAVIKRIFGKAWGEFYDPTSY